MSEKKFVLGVTGPSGAGKSTLSSLLAENFGAQVLCADKTAREVIDEKVLAEICAEFGREVFEGDRLNRQKLGKIVFENLEKRQKLNEIIWPRVICKIEAKVAQTTAKLVVIDVPMLFESGLDKICDRTVAVLKSKELRVEAIMLRDNISKNEALLRINAQPDDEFYKRNADFTLENNGTTKRLKEKFEEWQKSYVNL